MAPIEILVRLLEKARAEGDVEAEEFYSAEIESYHADKEADGEV